MVNLDGVLALNKEKMCLQFTFDEPQQIKAIKNDAVLYAVFDSINLAVESFDKEKVLLALAGTDVRTSFDMPEELVPVEPEAIAGYW